MKEKLANILDSLGKVPEKLEKVERDKKRKSTAQPRQTVPLDY